MQSQYVHFRWYRSLLLMGAALGLAVLLTWYHSGSVRENLQAVLHTHRAIHSGEQFLSALKDCETGQREYLLTGKEAYLAPFTEGKTRVSERLLVLQNLTHDNPAQQQRLEQITNLTAQQLRELELTIAQRRSAGPDSALALVSPDRGKAVMDQLRTLTVVFADAERALLQSREERWARAQSVQGCLQAGLLGLVMVTLALLLRSLHGERTARKGLLARIEAQNRSLLMNTGPDGPATDGNEPNEEAVVANLVTNLHSVTDFVVRIGQGQYEADLAGIIPQNLAANATTLSGALLRMRGQLIEVAEEDKRRSWATEGLARFAELLRTQAKDDQSLADQILRFLIRYLEANQGVLFSVESQAQTDFTAQTTGATAIRMVACYAYDRKKFLQKTLAAGEGLVGQCVQEADTIYLTEISREYVNITSGLGEATPTAILIVPLKLDGKVYGVVELASFKAFASYQIAFLEKLAESMASAMSTLRMQRRTNCSKPRNSRPRCCGPRKKKCVRTWKNSTPPRKRCAARTKLWKDC